MFRPVAARDARGGIRPLPRRCGHTGNGPETAPAPLRKPPRSSRGCSGAAGLQSGLSLLHWPVARMSMLLYSLSWRDLLGGSSRRLGGFDAPGDYAVLEFPPNSRHYPNRIRRPDRTHSLMQTLPRSGQRMLKSDQVRHALNTCTAGIEKSKPAACSQIKHKQRFTGNPTAATRISPSFRSAYAVAGTTRPSH